MRTRIGAGPGRASRPAPTGSVRETGGGPLVATVTMCDDQSVSVTVLIVDDHAAFRSSARALLALDGFAVVGEAEDGASALRLARALRPELVLLDVALPDVSGYDVAAELAAARTKVVLVSSRAQPDLGRRPGESGALGFVTKEHLSGEAILALMEAAA